jgi:WD40 repeat protein
VYILLLLGLCRYLQESGFVHSAFAFAHESMLSRTGLRAVDRSLPPGALITFLQKGLQYVGIEETLLQQQQLQEESFSGDVAASELADFTLLSPATLSALARPNPPIQLNVPPATAAAAIRARLEVEAKMQPDSRLISQQDTASLARQALEAAAQMASFQQQLLLGGSNNNHSYNNAQNELLGVDQQVSASQHQQALDLYTLQQTRPLASQPLTETNLQLIRAAAALHNVNQKRTLTGAKRGPKKQKKTKIDAASAGVEASLVPVRRSSLESSSARSEPEEEDEEDVNSPVQRVLATVAQSPTHNEDTTVSSAVPTAMEVDDDNDEQSQQKRSEPAHLGQEALPPPLSSKSIPGLTNGGSEHLHNDSKSNGSADAEAETDIGSATTRSGPTDADPEDQSTAADNDEILLLQMHESEVFMCAWNPVFTSLIATGSGDASARIWEMSGGNAKAGLKSVKLLPHGADARDKKNKDVTTLEWSMNGEFLATGSYDGIARVWSRNGALLHTLRKHTGPIFSLKWNKKGNYLLSGSYDTTAIVWDVSEEKQDPVIQQFTDHEAPALDVDWKDNDTFATCSTDKTVHIHRVGVARPLKVYRGHTDEVNAVKWDPSGLYLASCSDDCTAKVWEVESDRTEPLYDFTSHRQEIYTVKWSPTGPGSINPTKRSLLATASFDGTVRLWNTSDGSCFAVFNRHRDSVYSVAFSPSGDFLSSGSLAGQMYIWDIAIGQPVKSFKGKGDIFEVAWNKEETRVAACFSSNAVAVIDFVRSTLTV